MGGGQTNECVETSVYWLSVSVETLGFIRVIGDINNVCRAGRLLALLATIFHRPSRSLHQQVCQAAMLDLFSLIRAK